MWAFYFGGFTVQVVVVIVVLVRFFAPVNSLAERSFNIIYAKVAALGGLGTFNFIIEWADVLSGIALIMVVIPASISIAQSRRRQALDRVHTWAMDAISKLTNASSEESLDKKMADWEQRLHNLISESDSAKADARTVRNGLKPRVNKAVENLVKLEECLNNHAQPGDISTLLKTTVIQFKEITNLTYKSLYQSH